MDKKSVFYKSGYKHQTTRALNEITPIKPPEKIGNDYVTLSRNGYLKIVKGYAHDGPTGVPSIFKNWTRQMMRGATKHDGFYQLMRLGLLDRKLRKAVDKVCIDDFIEDGLPRVIAGIARQSIDKLGEKYTHGRYEPKERRAP